MGLHPADLDAPRLLRAALAVLAVALLAIPRLAHADVPPGLDGRPVREVVIEGTPDEDEVRRELGIPEDAPLTRGLVRGGLRRLGRLGLFSDVQIDCEPVGDGVRLLVSVVPRFVLARIEISGNVILEDEEVLRALGVTRDAEVRDDALLELEAQVRDVYARRGYRDAQVVTGLRETDEVGRKVLIVRIEEGLPTRVAGLVFDGDALPPRVDVRGALGVSEGQPTDTRRLDEGVRAAEALLRSRGYLEAGLGPVTYDETPTGTAVHIATEIGPHYRVELRRIAPLDRGSILHALDTRRERFGSQSVLRAMRERVLDVFLRSGFLDARVEVFTRVVSAGEVRLIVSAEPGAQISVESVLFPGAEHFESPFLRAQLTSYLEERVPGSTLFFPVDPEEADAIGLGGESVLHARDMPPPLVVEPARIYYAPAYTAGIEHVRELYQAAGFLDVRAGPATVTRTTSRTLSVEIPVEEGPRTRIAEVVFRGNDLVTEHALAEVAGLSLEAPFSYVGLEQAKSRIVDLYRERGHLFARVESRARFSADRTRAEVTIEIVESYPVRVGTLLVRGRERAAESMILEQMGLTTGELWVPSRVRRAQDRLLALGVFSAVAISADEPDVPERVKPMVITVTERPPQYLDVSAGFSTGQGARGGFEYGYRNLFGYAVSLVMRLQLGYQFIFIDPVLQTRFSQLNLIDRLERRIGLNLVVPYLPGLPNVRLSLDLLHLRDNERDFGYDKNGVALTAAWRPIRELAFTASQEVEQNNVGLFIIESLEQYLMTVTDPRIARLLRVPAGQSALVSSRVVGTLDARDSPFVPTRGAFASVAVEYARTLAAEQGRTCTETDFCLSNFFKISATVSTYVPIAEGVVFAAQVRYGRVVHLEPQSKTYPNRQFFLGGVDTMRGYLQDQMVPQDIVDTGAPPNSVVRGADTFVLLRGELRFPIFGAIQGGVFADIGNLWADASRLDLARVVPTAGLGLRLATPVGPLAFDYGFVLIDRRDAEQRRIDPIGSFHFSIGVF